MEIFHSIIEWLEKKGKPVDHMYKKMKYFRTFIYLPNHHTRYLICILLFYQWLIWYFLENFFLTKLNTETLKLYSTSMNSLWVQASLFSDKTNRGTATDFQRLAIQLQKLYIIVFKTVYNSYTIEFFSRNWISRG